MSQHTHTQIEAALAISKIIDSCDVEFRLMPSLLIPPLLIYALFKAARNGSISTSNVVCSIQFHPELMKKFLSGCCGSADIEIVSHIADGIKMDSGALAISASIMRAWCARQSIKKMLNSNGFLL